MAPIVHHPDVQRNLLTMRALTAAVRAICFACAHAIDMGRVSEGDEARHWQERANLLTPLAKAFSTDVGVEVASLGVQVHGGMGFIEETGAAAFYRDARIAPIYEGTNGIQAIDLVTRKLPLGEGEHVHGYIDETGRGGAACARLRPGGLGRTADILDEALDDLSEATRFCRILRPGARPSRRWPEPRRICGWSRSAPAALSGARRAGRRFGRPGGALPLLCGKPACRGAGPEGARHRRGGQLLGAGKALVSP